MTGIRGGDEKKKGKKKMEKRTGATTPSHLEGGNEGSTTRGKEMWGEKKLPSRRERELSSFPRQPRGTQLAGVGEKRGTASKRKRAY